MMAVLTRAMGETRRLHDVFYHHHTKNTLPADGRNHKRTHRTEFNKRMGRWICGCGWKSELVGKKRPKGNPGRSQKSEEATDELSLFFTKCEYEHRKDSCVV
jgi:hypothetical protein